MIERRKFAVVVDVECWMGVSAVSKFVYVVMIC